MLDIAVKNGYITDGSGNPKYRADVGIEGGRIVEIGRSISSADVLLDAKELVVSPGFIDMHSHSDFTLLVNPKAESSVRQGITTALIGNCGVSCAPISDATKELAKSLIIAYLPEYKINWNTFGEYLNRLRDQGVALNVAALVGHGTLRAAVMGFEDRLPTTSELEEMKELIAQSMKEGAMGMSTGLGYAPSFYSNTQELIELSKIVNQFGGIYVTHARSYGPQQRPQQRMVSKWPSATYGVKEAIEIGQETGIRVQISHIVAHLGLWHKAYEVLGMIDKARLDGIDVTCDQIPYTFGPGLLIKHSFPKWALEGGIPKIMERLNDPELREKIKTGLKPEPSWEEIVIEHCKSDPSLEGKSIAEIAKMREEDPRSVVLDIVTEEKSDVGIVGLCSLKEDIIRVLRHPTSMIGSDGVALASYGPLEKMSFSTRASWGAFPAVFRQFVREQEILRLEEAVRKMTSLPAQTLGLSDRGLIKEGMCADLVVFDPSTIADKDIFEEKSVYPEGIKFVIINGQLVIAEGKHTGHLPGKVLDHMVHAKK